ncbi:MAG: response regulator transcription factor [Spirochaetaceae bacterium]|nr:response regulator transcription factor [Spirochaetaceae bacterium]
MINNMKKILVVDDEEKIRKMICDYLEAVGYETVTAVDGIDAITQSAIENPDLVVLDIMMPGLDGLDCTRRIREKSPVPIIMVTAKAEEADKLIGLEVGADDYLVKPFSLKELAARIRAVLRRTDSFSQSGKGEKPTDIISHRDIVLNVEKMSVHRDGKKLELTSVQFEIFKLLISNPGRVFTRMQLLNAFQENAFEGYERTIDVHIKNIRKVVEPIPSKPVYIETVWGTGYRFSEESG